MATKMKPNSSVVTVVDVTDGTCAAVESDPVTAGLALKWTALRDRADGLAETGEILRGRYGIDPRRLGGPVRLASGGR